MDYKLRDGGVGGAPALDGGGSFQMPPFPCRPDAG